MIPKRPKRMTSPLSAVAAAERITELEESLPARLQAAHEAARREITADIAHILSRVPEGPEREKCRRLVAAMRQTSAGERLAETDPSELVKLTCPNGDGERLTGADRTAWMQEPPKGSPPFEPAARKGAR